MNDSEAKRILSTDAATHLEFTPVPLRFEGDTYFDVFAQKNNKTLGQTLDHHRYRALSKFVLPKYEQCLGRVDEFAIEFRLGIPLRNEA